MTIEGTGTQVTVRIWEDPVNPTPFSATSWDNAANSPMATLSGTISKQQDVARGFAVSVYEASSAQFGDIILDDFYFGDCP